MERDWDGNTHFWSGLLTFLLNLVLVPLYLTARLIRRFVVDVAKGVYGKIVLLTSAAVLAVLMGYFSGVFK